MTINEGGRHMSTLMDFEKKNEELISESYFRLSVIEKIFEIMERKKINQTDLAKRMNLSKSQVSRLLSDDRNLTLLSISKIFMAMEEEPAILSKSELNDLSKKQSNAQIMIHLQLDYGSMPRTEQANVPKKLRGRKVGLYNNFNIPSPWGKV